MSLLRNIINMDEIPNDSGEIFMLMNECNKEKQLVQNSIQTQWKNLEFEVINKEDLVPEMTNGTKDRQEQTVSEKTKCMNSPLESVISTRLSEMDFSSIKPRWSQKPILVAGGTGAGAGLQQLHHPNDIALDMNGHIYIADYSNKRVIRWTMNSNSYGEIIAGGDIPESSPLALRYPRRIHVTEDGTLFILDDDRVLKLSKDATHFTVITNTLGVPTSLFVDEKHNVYVSERSTHRILKWTPDMPDESEGIVIAGTGKRGAALNQFSWPRSVFVDHLENVYAVDRDNSRIQCWPKGALCGTTSIAHSNTRLLLGIKVDENRNIYAVDWRNSQILKYSSDGDEEVVVSDNGTHEVLNSPTDVEFDRHGNMFVNDKYNHRVLMFPLESGVFGF